MTNARSFKKQRSRLILVEMIDLVGLIFDVLIKTNDVWDIFMRKNETLNKMETILHKRILFTKFNETVRIQKSICVENDNREN